MVNYNGQTFNVVRRRMRRSTRKCTGSNSIFTVHIWRANHCATTRTFFAHLCWRYSALCTLQSPIMSGDSCQSTDCIKDIDRWMSSTHLKLIEDKTQFIWLGTWQQLAKVQCSTIQIEDVNIRVSTEVVCLGVVLDSEIKLTTRVRRLAGRCFCDSCGRYAVRRPLTLHKHW